MIGMYSKASRSGSELRLCCRILQNFRHSSNDAYRPNVDYGKRRSEYQQHLTELRKQWQLEFAEKQRQLQEQKSLEKKKIVLEKAVRLREKRKKSLLRQEEDRKIRERARQLHMEKLARNHLIWDEQQKLQQRRYAAALRDLEEEQGSWITLDNMESKITEELFGDEPATTGLKNKYSDFWRTHVRSMAYRMEVDFNPERYPPTKAASALEERLLRSQETRFTKRRIVEEFVDDMVSSGEDRERFKEYVDKFYDAFDNNGALDWVDKAHSALLDAESGIASDDDGGFDGGVSDFEGAVLDDAAADFEAEDEYFDFQAAEREESGAPAPAAGKGKQQKGADGKKSGKKGKK